MLVRSPRLGWLGVAAIALASAALIASPTPEGLRPEGQRALAVIVLAIGLWSLDAAPPGVTSLLAVVGLVASGAVPSLREALAGFADPVAYFLVGVLTIGVAVSHSGLAERLARLLLARGGTARALYLQLLLAFPLLTLVLPSATTRSGILVHVYDQALTLAGVPAGSAPARAIMLALNSVNRLASTILLTGGITPVVASGLIGAVSWTRWLVLMSVPYGALLVLAAAAIYLLHHRGLGRRLPSPSPVPRQPLAPAEIRTALITGGAALLWLTDAFHHWHPALPALLAWACLLAPGLGVLGWRDFERGVGWTNFLTIGASLSLAHALGRTGASAWLADRLLALTRSAGDSPLSVVVMLIGTAAAVRFLIPNITGFLATSIPVAMAVGTAAGLNPVVCGLIVTIAGDAVLYYPAQSASSLVVYERGHLSAGEIFRFGLLMTVLAAVVVVAVALPYWALVGEPLSR